MAESNNSNLHFKFGHSEYVKGGEKLSPIETKARFISDLKYRVKEIYYCKTTLGGLLRLVPDATHDFVVVNLGLESTGRTKRKGLLSSKEVEVKQTCMYLIEYFTTVHHPMLSISSVVVDTDDERGVKKAFKLMSIHE